VHLIDKMDGTLDGVPELLLPRQYVARWKQLLEIEMEKIRRGESDVNPYGATSSVECFPVLAEYFFEQQELFQANHGELAELMTIVFVRK
jgi:Mlc titration factor MtfA (ptsG expression regulator)